LSEANDNNWQKENKIKAKGRQFQEIPDCMTHKTKGSLTLYVAGFRPEKTPPLKKRRMECIRD